MMYSAIPGKNLQYLKRYSKNGSKFKNETPLHTGTPL